MKEPKLKTYAIAIAAALAIVPGGAYAKHAKPAVSPEDCLVNFDEHSKKYCMTDAQYRGMLDKISADAKAHSEANVESCAREIFDAKIIGGWIKGIKPNEEDCRPFAAQAQAAIADREAAADARFHHAKNTEIMKQCGQMMDTPAVDWREVAALRGVTVTMDDCVKASAGLAAEFGK
jgi:hypothetical protein